MVYMTEEEFHKEMKKIQEKNKQIELRNKLRAEKRKGRFSSMKMTTSNKVLIAAILAIILFTIACLYIQCQTSIEVSSTLITLWFSFWTVEVVSLAGIKVSKVFKEYKNTLDVDAVNSTIDADAVG